MRTETLDVMALAEDLSNLLPAGSVLAGAAYEQTRRIWNGAVDHRPALIVRPQTPRDVQDAVRAAREHRVLLSVRGGGHDWAGRSIREGGLVVDLSACSRVVVDPMHRTATVQGGATAGQVAAAAQPHGLAAVTGTTGGVGMVGLTLGGGYGPFNGKFGLALDNVLSAEVVLADGRRVTANRLREPELFWALRGGGGNFGVVTSMRIRLQPLEKILAGFIVYPWTDASYVLTRLGEILSDAPDELTVQTGVIPAPNGLSSLLLSPTWSGDLVKGEPVINQLQVLGTPLSTQISAMTPVELLSQFDAQIVSGRRYGLRTRTVLHYTPDIVAALIDAGDSRTPHLSGVFVHHFHGAATQVDVESTAFGIRQPHYMIEILAASEDHGDFAREWTWADRVANNLAPHAISGGYPNLLGPNDHDQIAHAYGPNAARLRAAKARFDPEDVFDAIPLPPEPACDDTNHG